MASLGPLRRRRLSAAVCCLACVSSLLGASAVSASWRSIEAPGGHVVSLAVASAETWLVEPSFACCTPEFELTRDAGGGWTPVQISGFPTAQLLGASSDGSFRVLAWSYLPEDLREVQLFRISPDGEVEPLGPVLSGDISPYAAAVGDDGTTWLPYRDDPESPFKLAVIDSGGALSTAALPPGAQSWKARRTVLGLRLLRYVEAGGYPSVFERGTLRLDGAGALQAAETYPVGYIDDELVLSREFSRESWDGGAHWVEGPVRVVPRAPGLGMPRYMEFGSGGVAERFSDVLFRQTGLEWPEGVPANYVVDAGSALVAWSSSTIYVHGADLPSLSTAIGDLQPDALAMLTRADQFRADAGLPPLTGDALVSQAAQNHAAYLALHSDLAFQSFHDEMPGSPGFTGGSMFERCQAVGTTCHGEVAYSPVPDPVGGWLATPYHRPLLGSPAAGVVGAGAVDGWSVMDYRADTNTIVRPFGYPVGRWRGDDGFSGESPDPVVYCKEVGRPIEYPVGIAVSLYLPVEEGEVSAIAVRKREDASPLPGCLFGDTGVSGATVGMFVLDDPLVEGQTYDVRAEWSPGSDWLPGNPTIPGPSLNKEWSFTYQPDAPTPVRRQRCRGVSLRSLRSTAPLRPGARRRRGKGVQVRVRLSGPARVKLRRAQLTYRTKRGRGRGRKRTVKLSLGRLRGRAVRLRSNSNLGLKLPPRLGRRLSAGQRVTLRLGLEVRGTVGCAARRSFSVRRGTIVGWIHMKGIAAWQLGSTPPNVTRNRRSLATRSGWTERSRRRRPGRRTALRADAGIGGTDQRPAGSH